MSGFTSRPVVAEDAPLVVAFHELPHTRDFVVAPTEDQVRAAVARGGREERIVLAAGEPVGMWLRIEHESWMTEARLVIAAQPGRGIGGFILAEIVRRTFVEREMHRLHVETSEDNSVMRGMLERRGFTYEGTFRDGMTLRPGEYKNLCAYGMLASDPGARKASGGG